MADDDRLGGVCLHDRLVGMKGPPQNRLDAQRGKRRQSDVDEPDPLAPGLAGKRILGDAAEQVGVLNRLARLLPLGQVCGEGRPRAPLGIHLLQPHQPIRIAKRQGAEDDGVALH